MEEPSDKVVEEEPADKVVKKKPSNKVVEEKPLHGSPEEKIINNEAASPSPQVAASEDVENAAGRSPEIEEEVVQNCHVPNAQLPEVAPPPGLFPAPPPPKSFALTAPIAPRAADIDHASGSLGLSPPLPPALNAADQHPSVKCPPSYAPPPAQAYAEEGSNGDVASAEEPLASLPITPGGEEPPSQCGSEGTAIEFVVLIHNTNSSSLGIGVAYTPAMETELTTNLFVNSVLLDGNGLIPIWNRTCPPEHRVASGDAIVAVNGVRDPSGMIAELRRHGELVISVRRNDTPMLAQPEPSQSQHRPTVQPRSAPKQKQPQPQQQHFPRQQPQQEQLPTRQHPMHQMPELQQQQRQELQQRRQQQQRQEESDPMQQWREQHRQQHRHQNGELGRTGLGGGGYNGNGEVEEPKNDMGLAMSLNDLSDIDFASLVCALAFKRRSLRPILESARTIREVLPSF